MSHDISLANISKNYGPQTPVLRNIDLCVDRGEYCCVIGPSGSGKSTLINIIGCLDSASSGTYLLMGEDVCSMSHTRMSLVRSQALSFIFQGFNLIDAYTALENVALPLLYRGYSPSLRRRKAEEALESVGLSNRLHHKPAQLSGGQQQRVAIARAIVSEPRILLADELTGNLDSRAGGEIMTLLMNLNALGTTLLLITHDAKIARSAKRVVEISDGVLSEKSKAQA